MRYVASAYSLQVMNLVACQHQENIYFYTTRDILPNEELMVWYCKDFASRLGYDVDPERTIFGGVDVEEEEDDELPHKKAHYAMAAPEIPAEVAVSHITYVMGLHLPGTAPPAVAPPLPCRRASPPAHVSTTNSHHPHIQHSRHASVIIGQDRSPLNGNCDKEPAGSPLCGKDTHYEHQLTPQDGSVRSVRSDEGYHSNECQEDGLTPPEDSSDSESEHNYVLDCSKKAIAPKETVIAQAQKPISVTPPAPTTPTATTPSCDSDKNEYRKFKVKMPLKYEFKNKSCVLRWL